MSHFDIVVAAYEVAMLPLCVAAAVLGRYLGRHNEENDS
jgi:hypothetical protein